MSCPPSRTAIAAPFFVFSARKATRAIITIIARVRVRVRVSCALRNLDFSMDISAYVRVTTRLEAKTPGKQILTTLPKNFGARL